MTATKNITDAQIRSLRAEALAAGDHRQVDICNRALTKDGETTDRDEARAECARVIADAAAQAD